jgi:hypothetical protein
LWKSIEGDPRFALVTSSRARLPRLVGVEAKRATQKQISYSMCEDLTRVDVC